MIMFVGLNPSTANESVDDPTIKRVRAISITNGYGGFYMMNCFPIISTDPSILRPFWESPNAYAQHQDVINRERLKEIAAICKDVVFAWGNFKVVQEVKRDKELLQMFPNAKALTINKNGSPKHPLYCKADIKLIDYARSKMYGL